MKTRHRIGFSLAIWLNLLFLGISNSTATPLTVGFFYPTNNQSFAAPTNIYVHAQVADSNVIQTVQYFSGGHSIGIVSNTNSLLITNLTQSNPFYIVWSNVTAGAYALTAVASDSAGNVVTSAPANITVTNPIIRPAVYIYSPANGASFLYPTNLTLYARSIETGGTVATVQFFANDLSVGVVSNGSQMVFTNISSEPLFPLSWPNPSPGTYALRAVATDLNGNSATSTVVNISVVTNRPPPPPIPYLIAIAFPTNGQAFVNPTNISIHAVVTDSNVVQRVQFFTNGGTIGIVSNLSNVLLTNSTQSNPFYFSWSNVATGTYSLTAIATDSQGNTATSDPVSITVTHSSPPPPPIIPFAVSFWYPTNGQKFLAPANIGVHALVTDSNVVRTVQYFANSNSIGVVTNLSGVLLTNTSQGNPFFLSWSNVLAGEYSLVAIATDTAGLTATSAPIVIIVTNPPPPPNIPFAIGFAYPTNGQIYINATNIGLHAVVTDSNVVQTVQYFANHDLIGIVSNLSNVLLTNTTQANPFFLTWSNVATGNYSLTAIAIDSHGNTATSSPVNITVSNSPPPVIRPSVAIYSPANGATYFAPTNVNIYARAVETSGAIAFVQFFANSINLGIVSNSSQVVVSNISPVPVFPLTWSNAPVGTYELRAVATDIAGNSSTSSVVNISILTNRPPPNIPFAISFWYPTNGQTFTAPANIGVHALVTDSNVVRSVQYFANGNSIGIVSNNSTVLLTNSTESNPFFLSWSNVLAGNYALTAVATDSAGQTATSAPVNIIVTNRPPPHIPFAIAISAPTNGQKFLAPATITIHAVVVDSNVVQTVQFFANGNSLGVVSNHDGVLLTNSTQSNPFSLTWSNVMSHSYSLTAVATDIAGHTATSGPVNIYVMSNLPPVVSIYASDPVAVEGTNYIGSNVPPATASNYVSGANTATFVIHRDGSTNTDLTVYYSVTGTASNGVDYQLIPNYVNIPAGKTYALVTVVPLDDTDSSYRSYDTVILSLTMPPLVPTSAAMYNVGSPQQAAAIILEENLLPIPQPMIHGTADNSMHISLPATNGMNFCLQISSDLVNWQPVCTNTVVKGSAQFVDPSPTSPTGRFYRIVPAPAPASY